MKDRVIIFIDGSNLYHSLKNNFKRVDLNFAEFTRKLVGAATPDQDILLQRAAGTGTEDRGSEGTAGFP